MNRAGVMLCSLVCLGTLATHVGDATLPTITPQRIAPVEKFDALERARRASFDVVLRDFDASGSAVLVGRTKVGNKYRYRALSAYHVFAKMSEAMIANKTNTSHKVLFTFQQGFHDLPMQLELNLEDIDWAAPAEDWTSFTFVTEMRLECADVASEAEFRAIKPWEPIHLIACYGHYGQMLRKGVISSTHNVGVYPKSQLRSTAPWNKRPTKFFRVSTPIWFGDSGGAIFNKDGKLIGIVNGLTTGDPFWGPVPHSGVAVKTHVIVDVVSFNKDFFKIED